MRAEDATDTRPLSFSPDLAGRHDIVVVDTEFSRLPYPKEAMRSWAASVELLSLAAVSLREPARCFYAVRQITPAVVRVCSPFVVAGVLPQLMGTPPDLVFADGEALKVALGGFLQSLASEAGRPGLIAVDYLGDALLIEHFTALDGRYVLVDNIREIEEAKHRQEETTLTRHMALHDAQVMRDGLAARMRRR